MNDFLKEIEAEVIGKITGATQVHLRVQQRNNRKCWTLIEGIDGDGDVNMKSLLKTMKKKFSCNGSIQKGSDGTGLIIQLQGDHRIDAEHLLVKKLKIFNAEDVVIHG